jgi:hypothetical protein
MYNPDTGDVVRATDGCEIESLRKSGYTTDVPPDVAEDYDGPVQGGDTGAQSAGVGLGLFVALGAGALYLSQ